jgi:hypothetical protein
MAQNFYSNTGHGPNPTQNDAFANMDWHFQQMQIAPRGDYHVGPWQQMSQPATYPAYQPAPVPQDVETLEQRLGDSRRVRKILSSTMKVSSLP